MKIKKCLSCGGDLPFKCHKFCQINCRIKYYKNIKRQNFDRDWLSIKLKEKGLRYD